MARKSKSTSGMVSVILRGVDMTVRGYARSTRYRQVHQGLLPPPVNIGPKAGGWPVREIELIEAARAAGCRDADIRLLVAQLLMERQERFVRLAKAAGVTGADLGQFASAGCHRMITPIPIAEAPPPKKIEA